MFVPEQVEQVRFVEKRVGVGVSDWFVVAIPEEVGLKDDDNGRREVVEGVGWVPG